MSAESMTDFVRELFLRSEDFKSLTQNMICEQYMQHIGVTSLDDQNISLLRQIVEILLLEMMYNDGVAQPNECNESGIVTSETLNQHVTTLNDPSNSINNKMHFVTEDLANSTTESSTIVMEESVVAMETENNAWLAESSNGATAKTPIQPNNPSLIKKPEKTRFIYKEITKKRPSEKPENEDSSGIRFAHLLKSKKKSTEGKGWVVINLGANMTRVDIGKLLQKRKPGTAPKKKKKKGKKKETAKKTVRILDSESESENESDKKSSATTVTGKRKRAEKKDAHERRLEKIARSCGVLPVGKNYKTTFEGCQTSKERSDKLIQLLREAGMKGPITKKNAEEFRLKREAQELEEELREKKITVTEGRSHRNVYSIYSRHAYDPKPLKFAATSPMKTKLSRSLLDVIDSDESSDN